MTAESKKTALRLPLVTLRGLTITPNARLQITAARQNSIAAFKEAKSSKAHQLAVFCQMDDKDENPEFKSLHKLGVICKLISLSENDNDTCQALINGFARIKLLAVIDEEDKPYREAKVEIVNEPSHPKEVLDENLETLQSAVKYAIENQDKTVHSLIESSVPTQILEQIGSETDLSKLTDVLTQMLKLDPQDKLILLRTVDPLERCRILISALNGFSYRSELEKRIVEEAKASMERNQRDYYLHEQIRAIRKELGESDNELSEIESLKAADAALEAPKYVHDRIQREIKKLRNMNYNSSESTIIRSYIDTLLQVPWQTATDINRDLKKAQEVLEKDHYGLKKVKDRILEYLAVQAKADRLHGPILCLMGPPGIGKTSLGESIARATGRKFVRVSLGGVYDEAEIRGHRRTYVGALPGRIMQNMIKTGVNNPLFLLDEIDKMGDSSHGDPAAALLEVLDPEQNKTFSDNYVEIDNDLSNVMFVTTANSYNISGPLLDRMEVIDLSSYTEEEKFNIAKQHLLPKQMRLNSLTDKEFEIEDDAITELIRYYTHEAGVRGLERLLNELCRKAVKDDMLESEGAAEEKPVKKTRGRSKSAKAKALETEALEAKAAETGNAEALNAEKGPEEKEGDAPAPALTLSRKRTITAKDLHDLLGPRRYDFTSKLKDNKVGLVNGLAWTSLGGDILQLEAVANEGKGKHVLTGKLGEVMKESISAALTLVRSMAKDINLDPGFYEQCDLHIHVPEGATPKEGPSAGVGMVTAIISALTGNPVRADVAMTGEITLRGDILPIGGLKEKLLAALRGGIKQVFIPQENEKDLWDIPENVKTGLTITPVKRIEEVINGALVNKPAGFKPTTEYGRKKNAARKTARKTASKAASEEEA